MKRNSILGMLVATLLVAAFAPARNVAARKESPFEEAGGANGARRIAPPGAPAASRVTLPVFRFLPPVVNQDTTQRLTGLFGGINSNSFFSDTTHTGSLRFTSINTQTGSLLEQYGATGGFFAYNARRAFSETEALQPALPEQVCSFLMQRQLFPADIAPGVTDCGGQLPYAATPIYLSTFTPTLNAAGADAPAGAQATSSMVQIGLLYQVPLAINVGAAAPDYIPLSGPGGHLSILVTGSGDQETLDPALPGLNAIADPFFGRQRDPNPIGNYDVVPMDQAIQQLRGSLPPGTVITPGNPGLMYYVDHPAVTQTVIMPMWVFTDAMANVGGQEVDLKGVALPGVEGFLPDVKITDPSDGAIYFPGRPVTVTGTISGSAGPFSYTLSVDGGGVLRTGVAPSGTVQLALDSVPLVIQKGSGDNIVLRLSATDGNGATGEDTLQLESPLFVYLPLVLRNFGGTSAQPIAAPDAGEFANAPARLSAAFTMGTEWIKYYNGTNPDLPGVPGDANGFYSGLAGLGWTGRFNYGNNLAWERDWRDCSLGGSDCTYGVDRAEFVYFSGHGSPARIYFGTNLNAYNFFGGNARFQNVRWAAFSSCQTLRAGPYVGTGDPPLTYWFNAFQGAYMLLGFHSSMGDVAFGGPLVDNMRLPKLFGVIPLYSAQRSIREAWVLTAFEMNAGKPAYLYAVGSFNPVDLKLPDPLWLNYSTPPLTGIYQYRWVWWNE